MPVEKQLAFSTGILVLAVSGGALAAVLQLTLVRTPGDSADTWVRAILVPAAAAGLLGCLSVVISAADHTALRIPNRLLACAAVVVLLAAGTAVSAAGVGGGGSAPLLERLGAMSVPCVLLVSVWWCVPTGIGAGDVKLGIVATAAVAGFGEAPWLRAGALLCGFALALTLQNLRRRRIRARVTAAGPWLLGAAWVTYLLLSPGLGALAASGSATG